ncbi:hypothetical protein TSUD_155570 [Trifolium subterraneum]|uniref:Protein FAR1-RELATED SEQUENCE n=1 Tax=Trifolium subterraneum TaxID=3900 RepID=A0A2Z6MTT2_TRISU|nr:hypothetical protein TSUD_155570 [Trifolium subterraneum]
METNGLWYITKFDPSHSHECNLTKARLFKANKKINLHVKRTIEINDDAGVTINKTFQSLIKDAGGCSEYKKIKAAMKEAVYDTYTTNDFEEKWCFFNDKFELQQNNWLSGLHNERHRWVPTLLRKTFWAGMSTTQRSESIHAFFDRYINSTTTLRQFVKQYDNSLRSRAEKEFQADFNSMDTTIPCGATSLIENQFQCVYTHAKFKDIQGQFLSKMKDLSCECSLFEFRGILCRHALCVFAHERIANVPEKYILSRWKKNIKRKHSYVKSSYNAVELKPQMERFDKLCKHFYNVIEVAAESEVATKQGRSTMWAQQGHGPPQGFFFIVSNYNYTPDYFLFSLPSHTLLTRTRKETKSSDTRKRNHRTPHPLHRPKHHRSQSYHRCHQPHHHVNHSTALLRLRYESKLQNPLDLFLSQNFTLLN